MAFQPGRVSKADAAAYSSSDSDDGELDQPDPISGDPRSDYLDDLKPRKRRRYNNAKESAALGIFGSDSEDDGPSYRRKNGKRLRHQNMSFVSAGRNGTNETREEDDNEDMEDDEGEGEDEYAEPTQFGLGNGGRATAPKEEADDDENDDELDEDLPTGVGLGFHPVVQGWAPPSQPHTKLTPPETNISQPRMNSGPGYNVGKPLGQGFVPSSANVPVLKQGLDEAQAAPTQAPKPSAFSGKPNGRGGAKMSFGARMLAKMGHVEGKGLGAEGQGRNVIIEANLRPQGVGLGAVKEKTKQEREEEKRQARIRGEEVLDSEEEDKKKRKRIRERKMKGLDSGTASGSSTPRRPKTKYLTVNDMQKAAPGLHIPDAFAPILDMTGPGQKLLTPGSGLMTPTAGVEHPEQTEARKLAGRAQRDLNAFVEEWKTLEERKAWLDMEAHQREQELEELQGALEDMQSVALLLDTISIAANNREWDPVIAGLEQIEASAGSDRLNDEELAGVAVAAIHPFLRDAVQGWQPLEDPKLANFADDLTAVRGILGLKESSHTSIKKTHDLELEGLHRQHQRSTTPYESMAYKLLFPKLVTMIAQQWDVYEPAPLQAVFDKWKYLFPPFVKGQLIEQVVRRLNDAISSWRPRKKQQHLPHLWLFPWLQHLPAYHLDPKGTGVVSDVRRKFRQLVDVWDFERGVIPGMKEWKSVLRPTKATDQWSPLIMHHVLPSMAKYLRQGFQVDRYDQEPFLPMLKGVLKWSDMISPAKVAEVVVATVFPMWHDVLYRWLMDDEADYEEIPFWLEWWQDMVLATFAGVGSVEAEFDRAEVMVRNALNLGTNIKRLAEPSGRPAYEPRSHSKLEIAHSHPTPPVVHREPVQKSFREEVEDWCHRNDLHFIPTRSRTTDSGQKHYRITGRMDGKGGVLAHFVRDREDAIVIESRKTNMKLRRGEDGEKWDDLVFVLHEVSE